MLLLIMESHSTFFLSASFSETLVRALQLWGTGVIKSCWLFYFFFSSSSFSSVVLLPPSFSPRSRTKLLADAAALGNRRTRRGAMFCSSYGEKMCVWSQGGSDDSLCFQQRARCPWRPPLTHEYLARQLTVIGYCVRAAWPCLCSLPARTATFNSSLSSCHWQQTRWFENHTEQIAVWL